MTLHSMLYSFLENTSIIIAALYLSFKGKSYLYAKAMNTSIMAWASPFLASLLSVLVMYHPFEYEGMRFDLRSAPLYFISFVGGWKMGVASVIFPSIYRFSLGGPTVMEGILHGILLPAFIGSLFHSRSHYNPPFTTVNIKRMMWGFAVFITSLSVLMYVTLPVSLIVILIMAIGNGIAILIMGMMLNDNSRDLRINRDLWYQSFHDALTDLPNLRLFREVLSKKMAYQENLVIVMVDVDHFKQYNDTYGHPKGDEVLIEIGKILKKHIRKQDICARYGGEEFILCISGIDSVEEVRRTLERLRLAVQEHKFFGEQTQPGGKITISLGHSKTISTIATLEKLVEEADQALYQSKHLGRNRVS